MEIHEKGVVVKIDDEDSHFLKEANWYVLRSKKERKYVVVRKIKNCPIYLHRLILGVEDRKILVDHINGDCVDNRRSNLRVCTNAENMRNQRKSSASKSPYKGITWIPKNKKWMAQITDDKGKHRYLGSFVDPIEAHAAYCEASKKYHGEFGRTE